MFATVLHSLKSPNNVGTIVRSHVAFGGGPFVFVGYQKPWDFRKSTQAFSRKLERLIELVFLPDDEAFFGWCSVAKFIPVAVEISASAVPLPQFVFPSRPAVVVGSEAAGLSATFLNRCANVVAIPQFGEAECLNVGVSASIALYELNRQRRDSNAVAGAKYVTTRA